MAKKEAGKLQTASVLAFERKLSNSDGLMYAGNWEDIANAKHWQAIKIQSKDVRGTISNRQPNAVTNDPGKLNQKIESANLQRVDVAALPFDTDTLNIRFTLRVLGNLKEPSACNNQEYQKVLADQITAYIEEHQFQELAARYAESLANGRFLWRNRVGSEAVEVQISHKKEQQHLQNWTFNGLDFNLRRFSQQPSNDLKALAQVIQEGLKGEAFAFLEVSAFVRLGAGQEVFPSQELVLDGGGNDSKKSKYLYQVNGVAALHSQKIGNALRTIDTWYPQVEELGPIAVEPYGSVTSKGIAYRQPKDDMDFYTLLDNWMLKDKKPAAEQQHYVIATLIRGGVFGDGGKD